MLGKIREFPWSAAQRNDKILINKHSPFFNANRFLRINQNILCVSYEKRTYFSWSQNVGKPRPATAAEVSAVEAVAVVEARGGTAEEAAVSDLTPTERGYS